VHDAELDELLPAAPPGANLGLGASRAARRRLESKRDWAHVVDVNATMGDFHKLVPDMAHKVRGPLARLDTVC
jgi:antiviral helicase SKI2